MLCSWRHVIACNALYITNISLWLTFMMPCSWRHVILIACNTLYITNISLWLTLMFSKSLIVCVGLWSFSVWIHYSIPFSLWIVADLRSEIPCVWLYLLFRMLILVFYPIWGSYIFANYSTFPERFCLCMGRCFVVYKIYEPDMRFIDRLMNILLLFFKYFN